MLPFRVQITVGLSRLFKGHSNICCIKCRAYYKASWEGGGGGFVVLAPDIDMQCRDLCMSLIDNQGC